MQCAPVSSNCTAGDQSARRHAAIAYLLATYQQHHSMHSRPFKRGSWHETACQLSATVKIITPGVSGYRFIGVNPFFCTLTRLHRARRSCDMYGSAATPRTENGGVAECSPSSYLHVSVCTTRNPNKVSSRKRLYPCKGPLSWPSGPGPGENNCTNAPTASVVDRVSRRHGRVSPEEQGRNLGRSVTAIYRLCSLVGRLYSRLLKTSQDLCHALARW